MGVNTKVEFSDLHRDQASGNVTGNVVLKVYGDLAGVSFDHSLENRAFNFPKGGEQEVYRKEFQIKILTFILTAKVHEHTAGQCCIQGHIHVDAPIGGGIGKDLDPNCHAIPE